MTRFLSQHLLTGLILAAGIGFSSVSTGFSQTADPEAIYGAHQLSLLSFDNRNPAIAYSADGARLFVVWDGLVQGNRRIILREQVEGEWLPPVIVDSNPAGNNSLPSIGVDKAGIPHVAWISSINGKRSPMYARRLTRFPNEWFSQPVPFPGESTVKGSSDFVNLQLSTDGQPWIVWQYGYGNVYSIACTRYNDSGELQSTELTPGASTHNLYPELFFMPEPTVYWYLAQSDQFFLIGASFDSNTNRWEVSLPENLENLPADNLPDLFKTASGPLGAIWYDRQQSGTSDRIFLGLQDPETRGGGEVIDEQPGAGNHSVAGTAATEDFVTAWISETYEGGAHTFLGFGDSPGSISSIQLSESDQGISSNPKVAGSDGKAAVTWEEKPAPGAPSSEIMVRVTDISRL
jgi:hypothetical protein